MRNFDSGATRDTDENKPDYEGFLSPVVLEAFGEYMNKNRVQADGKVRASDNWQKGIPRDAYMKSAWRHFFAAWKSHRAGGSPLEDLCALMFNVMGYIYEIQVRDNKGYVNKEWTSEVWNSPPYGPGDVPDGYEVACGIVGCDLCYPPKSATGIACS